MSFMRKNLAGILSISMILAASLPALAETVPENIPQEYVLSTEGAFFQRQCMKQPLLQKVMILLQKGRRMA